METTLINNQEESSLHLFHECFVTIKSRSWLKRVFGNLEFGLPMFCILFFKCLNNPLVKFIRLVAATFSVWMI